MNIALSNNQKNDNTPHLEARIKVIYFDGETETESEWFSSKEEALRAIPLPIILQKNFRLIQE